MTAIEPLAQPSHAHSAKQEMARFASQAVREKVVLLFALAIVAAGLAVRLWRAGGPLTLDEIWSIENITPLHHFWQVFWGISHDNNHFLNSLWLYFATGFSDDVRVFRAPSIVMGALTIVVMARLAGRAGRAAAMAAAAMTGASYFLVNYSVEARGYAGLALAIVVCFEALETSLAHRDSRARFVFAGAAGLGALWHLAMLPAVALLALVHLGEEKRRNKHWATAVNETVHFLAPAILAVIPAIGFIFAGAFVVGRFTIGGARAFEAQEALNAIASLVRNTIGAPDAASTGLVLVATALVIALALRFRLASPDRRIAYAVILLALPAAVFVLRPPNAHIARYYLICALFLILLAAEIFGRLWRAGGLVRWGALAVLALILLGDIGKLGLGGASADEGWPQALSTISASGERTVGSNFDDRVGKFVAYYNRAHPPLDLVARTEWCVRRPRWLIAELPDGAQAPPDLDLPAGDCRTRFDFVGRYQAWGLSQMTWALYRAP
jgi:hypothetical protein